MGLQKFCTLCGSLRHAFDVCTEAAHLSQRQYDLMDIGTNPYVTVQERKEAIDEYKTIKEVGETSASVVPMHTDTTQVDVSEATVGQITLAQASHTQLSLPQDPTASQQDHRTKRKTREDNEGEASTSTKRLQTEQSDQGLTVLLKPSQQP